MIHLFTLDVTFLCYSVEQSKGKGRRMENKGFVTALYFAIGYPIGLVLGLILSIVNYPLAILDALFDPETP